jgi:hypothetical protein
VILEENIKKSKTLGKKLIPRPSLPVAIEWREPKIDLVT